jgi:hypothetical protein
VVVALGEPGVPVICCAFAAGERAAPKKTLNDSMVMILIILLLPVGHQNMREHAQPH